MTTRLFRPWLKKVAVVLVIVVGLVYAGLMAVAYRVKPVARAKAIELLEQDFDRVELAELDLDVHPGFLGVPAFRARGEGLAVSLRDRTDAPPFISINEFEVRLSVLGVLRSPVRLDQLFLDELEIQIPPSRPKTASDDRGPKEKEPPPGFVIDRLFANGTVLRILPKDSEKEPMVFTMHELRLDSVGLGGPMTFETELDNPKPPGRVDAEGSFGPLRLDEPGLSPLSGRYVFNDADLSVFGGIGGILDAEGAFEGRLEHIEVEGTADVPEFMLVAAGQPVPLRTAYQAIVDGTNGDTRLGSVEAELDTSRFETSGGVTKEDADKGKVVRLEAHSTDARIEDFLRLAMPSEEPWLMGAIRFESIVVIPPGDIDVVEKLELDGNFTIERATFPETIQEKVEAFSEKARGADSASKSTGDSRVVSDLAADFALDDGTMTLTNLVFSVPGAKVELDGSFHMVDQQLDFHGTVTLDAAVSELTTGFKSTLLKLVDPFFRRENAGARIPITVTGTTNDPKLGLDVGRLLSRGP